MGMVKCIECEAAVNAVLNLVPKVDDDGYCWVIRGDAARAIDSIPAADVRPVVTCANCKYNKREVTDLWGNDAIQCITGQTHGHDWFCADGKKREER